RERRSRPGSAGWFARIPGPTRPGREARFDGSSTPLATALAARGAARPGGLLSLARATRAVTPKSAVLRGAAIRRSSKTCGPLMHRSGSDRLPIAPNHEQTRRVGPQGSTCRQKSTSLTPRTDKEGAAARSVFVLCVLSLALFGTVGLRTRPEALQIQEHERNEASRTKSAAAPPR